MSWQSLKYKVAVVAGLVVTGTVVWLSWRAQVKTVDMVELIEGVQERCLATQTSPTGGGEVWYVTNQIPTWANTNAQGYGWTSNGVFVAYRRPTATNEVVVGVTNFTGTFDVRPMLVAETFEVETGGRYVTGTNVNGVLDAPCWTNEVAVNPLTWLIKRDWFDYWRDAGWAALWSSGHGNDVWTIDVTLTHGGLMPGFGPDLGLVSRMGSYLNYHLTNSAGAYSNVVDLQSECAWSGTNLWTHLGIATPETTNSYGWACFPGTPLGWMGTITNFNVSSNFLWARYEVLEHLQERLVPGVTWTAAGTTNSYTWVGSGTSWVDACTDFLGASPSVAEVSDSAPVRYLAAWDEWFGYSIQATTIRSKGIVTGLYTGLQHSVDFYCYTEPGLLDFVDRGEFYDYTTGADSNVWSRMDVGASGWGGSVTSAWIGSTSKPTDLSIDPMLDQPGAGEVTSFGYQTAVPPGGQLWGVEALAVVKWGFERCLGE